MRYFEDLVVGTKASFGHYEVTRDEVIEFASKFDPQPFHLDDEAAAQTYFGRMSASGWHTCAMSMRMMVDEMSRTEAASLGSPGIDELRWLKPVYPGDTLRIEAELIEKRQSKSKPHLGFTKTRQTTFNQDDEPVMTMIGNGITQVRDPGAAPD